MPLKQQILRIIYLPLFANRGFQCVQTEVTSGLHTKEPAVAGVWNFNGILKKSSSFQINNSIFRLKSLQFCTLLLFSKDPGIYLIFDESWHQQLFTYHQFPVRHSPKLLWFVTYCDGDGLLNVCNTLIILDKFNFTKI
jgi:hypothetical protein